MFIVSVSFADVITGSWASGSCPTSFDFNGLSYYNKASAGGQVIRLSTYGLSMNTYFLKATSATCQEVIPYNGDSDIGYTNVYTYSSISCSSGQTFDTTIQQCVDKPDPLNCDKSLGAFSNLDGTCNDCSSHLTDTDVTAMANCACGASGSTYTPSALMQILPVDGGKYSYTQSNVKCSDGSQKYVYYNKHAISDNNSTTPTTPTDNNSTTPTDNNSSVPTDTNGTSPTDTNGTKDSNGTKPTGTGSGTGNGNDYSGVLNDIRTLLGSINDTMKNSSDPSPNSHNIPTDTKGGSWDNYSEAWDNIVGRFDEVKSSIGTLQGIIDNGFSSPFTKSSIDTCVYVTSFEFGAVGTIPLSVDFCKVFTPLRGVFYTFTYLALVLCLLYFFIKQFLKLV